ncbi:efflux RND transporter periplasmic adaptor subunit [Bosea lathyri]|uniref:Membrane fusion protein, multidrug efflux system n=1 Tax=Bosea lathyri TaxID=1036778 RepID=A0A1H5S0F7_9HYPH|nr:efflux RND transporter periplasmic adaptor subunit [Bosea lathyri]SEF44079.1 membrane fusion protein, multidrug efflux system [Bosea lathyri]
MTAIEPRRRPTLLGIALACQIFGAAGGAQAQAPRAAPPPQVTVVEVKAGKVPLSFEYAARVEASREVQVRAQVGGILLKRDFVEGALVKAGDTLFEIDPKRYEAELVKARAQLQQAQAQLAQASRDAERYTRLAATGSGTDKARDDALSAKELAAAAVSIAEADVNLAELNLGYTKVKAPISGVTSLEQVPEGSLIGITGDAGLLTKITQRDPVYVIFSASENEIAQARTLLEAQGVWDRAGEVLKVQVVFGDGQVYPQTGTIDFASAGLDAETGTLRLRAVVANPKGLLLPGQFVRAVVSGFYLDNTIVVPHVAVSQGAQGQFVYTVDSAGKAELRPIELGRELPSGWIVKSGLKPGDKLITEGIIKVHPGAPVTVSMKPAETAKP